jgi:hypothetical protein
MLVGQARKQFEWWTGTRPSAAVMRQAAIEKLQQFTHDTTINAGSAESAEAGFSRRAPRPPR